MNSNTKSVRTTLLCVLLLWLVCGLGAYLTNPYIATECGLERRDHRAGTYTKSGVIYDDFQCLQPTVHEIVKKNIILVVSGPWAFRK